METEAAAVPHPAAGVYTGPAGAGEVQAQFGEGVDEQATHPGTTGAPAAPTGGGGGGAAGPPGGVGLT